MTETLIDNYLRIYLMIKEKHSINDVSFLVTIINTNTIIFQTLEKVFIGSVGLKQLEGNCNVALLYDINFYEYENISSILQFIKKICSNCGIKLIILTVNNEYLANIFIDNYFIISNRFFSNKSQTLNYMFIKEIEDV